MRSIPKRSRVPAGLLVADIGGLFAGPERRKHNFLRAGKRFLTALLPDLGISASVETEAGPRRSSGVARLRSRHLVIELSEPASREGLHVRWAVRGASGNTLVHVEEPVAPLASEEAFEDFVCRVKAMLVLNGEPTASSEADPAIRHTANALD